MRTILHALRVVGSTLENNLNLRFWPYPLHIPSCYYIPAILNSHSGASTIKTLFQRRSDGSVLGTYYDEPRPTQKVGKVENIFCFWRFSTDIGIWYAEVYELLGSAVDMLFLPSLKFYSFSRTSVLLLKMRKKLGSPGWEVQYINKYIYILCINIYICMHNFQIHVCIFYLVYAYSWFRLRAGQHGTSIPPGKINS